MDLHEAEQTLEVTAAAPEKTIQEAFRDKARETHPDISDEPGTEEQFQRIVTAREILLSTDPTDVGNDDAESQDTAQTQRTQSASTRSSEPREHTTRASTGAAAGTTPNSTSSGGSQVSRTVSDTWTGLSPRELLIVIRDNTIPYWETFRHWSVRSLPVLAALIVGMVALEATGGLIGGVPQFGVVILSQLFAARLAIHESTRFKGTRPEHPGGRVPDIVAYGHPRNYLPTIGVGMTLYLTHRFTGATFGGVMPSMVVTIVFALMTLTLAGSIYAAVKLIGWSVNPVMIVFGSAVLSAFTGFSSFYTPLFFGADSTLYVFLPSIMLLNFDIGLIANVALSMVLLYSTVGFFILSAGKTSHFIRNDWDCGLNVNPAVWHTAVVLPITITFWLGANPALGHAVVHVIREPALLYAVCISSPGYIYVLYRLRRGLEMWLLHGKFHRAYFVGRRYYDDN